MQGLQSLMDLLAISGITMGVVALIVGFYKINTAYFDDERKFGYAFLVGGMLLAVGSIFIPSMASTVLEDPSSQPSQTQTTTTTQTQQTTTKKVDTASATPSKPTDYTPLIWALAGLVGVGGLTGAGLIIRRQMAKSRKEKALEKERIEAIHARSTVTNDIFNKLENEFYDSLMIERQDPQADESISRLMEAHPEVLTPEKAETLLRKSRLFDLEEPKTAAAINTIEEAKTARSLLEAHPDNEDLANRFDVAAKAARVNWDVALKNAVNNPSPVIQSKEARSALKTITAAKLMDRSTNEYATAMALVAKIMLGLHLNIDVPGTSQHVGAIETAAQRLAITKG